jgi:YesN/AraC family two-component response regulator
MEKNKANLIFELIDNFLDNKSILIIDDEVEIKALMSNYLIKSQVDAKRIITASDGKEAISKIQNQDFGLIIVDILMPRMNGLQLIKELKQRKKYQNIPVLIVSGSVDADNVKVAASMGITNIIVKPFNYNIFLEKVSKTLTT